MAINASPGGVHGGAFESMHSWSGTELLEAESDAFQNGKAAAVKVLEPHTADSANEAATVVVKLTGESTFYEGTKTEVKVEVPHESENMPVAVLHSHSRDISFSLKDWKLFLSMKNFEQQHIVAPSKTFSLHKPWDWNYSQAPSAQQADDTYYHFMEEYWRVTSEKDEEQSEVAERKYVGEKMCARYGILYREGLRV